MISIPKTEDELNELIEKANSGDDFSQTLLGAYYEKLQAYESAVKWYRLAADNGNATAMLNLGFAYFQGQGADKDEEKAFSLFLASAKKGDSAAQYNVGYCYCKGHGVAKDEAEGAKWWAMAAEQDYPDATYCLGLCYYCGEGVHEDEEKGLALLEKAAALGQQNAVTILKRIKG